MAAMIFARPAQALGVATILVFLTTVVYRHSQSLSSTDAQNTYDPDLQDDVLNSTLGFQKIFVINLPSRTDHRDAASLAAAYTGLDLTFIDGITHVDNKTLPPGAAQLGFSQASLGNARAHLNIARTMVEQNIASALILEDDADWDIRIKSQMQDFARSSRLLLQPVPGTEDTFLDPSYPRPDSGQRYIDLDVKKLDLLISEPVTSPYGDLHRWDLLWLGHCGCRFPRTSDGNVPIGRAVLFDDETVPERQHVNMQFGDSQLVTQYPHHTRVVSRARVNTCSLAYGISQQGARRLFYEVGLNKLDGPTDMMLRAKCDGSGRDLMTCLTVQPQLFQHHRPVGSKAAYSDISYHGDAYNGVAFTRNVRWSTRVNLGKLVNGDTNYTDLYRDGQEPMPLEF